MSEEKCKTCWYGPNPCVTESGELCCISPAVEKYTMFLTELKSDIYNLYDDCNETAPPEVYGAIIGFCEKIQMFLDGHCIVSGAPEMSKEKAIKALELYLEADEGKIVHFFETEGLSCEIPRGLQAKRGLLVKVALNLLREQPKQAGQAAESPIKLAIPTNRQEGERATFQAIIDTLTAQLAAAQKEIECWKAETIHCRDLEKAANEQLAAAQTEVPIDPDFDRGRIFRDVTEQDQKGGDK